MNKHYNTTFKLIDIQSLLPFLLILIISFDGLAQNKNKIAYTKAKERNAGFEIRKRLDKQSLLNNIPYRNVGPAVMSGRVTDLAVNPKDPSHFYVAYASGGLWETSSNGTSFRPVFDNQPVMTIGDIAVYWNSKNDTIIWIGTGENNSSRSSYAGNGIYKSMDNGKTWQHLGLEETHHTGRIVLHPQNSDIAWVAALGHLYSPNKERGIYKTTDGGKTWKQTLFVNENAGAIDLIIDENNPETLYASTWERTRRAWDFVEGGEGSAIYKSTDSGEKWTLISTKESGFPTGKNIGRIGLCLHRESGILYASLDNQNRRPKEEEKEETDNEELTKDDLRAMSKESFLALEDKKIEGFLKKNGFPKKYDVKTVKGMVKSGKIQVLALVEYLEDANSELFDTPVIGAEVYRSTDDGKTWTKTHEGYLDDVFYSYGYYFGEIRVSPQDKNKVYLLGVPIIRSDDGGKTFQSINGDNVHADHHALWMSKDRPGHLVNGNDGGVNISYDDGKSWYKCNTPPVGQFYTVYADMEEPYNVYGGLQDNGVWVGSSTYKASEGWHGSGEYPYKSIMGGDGFQVAVDNRNSDIVYTGFQFGNYFRIDRSKDDYKRISPKHDLGERPLRFNWQTPIHLSVHNQDILYLGFQ